MNHTPYSRPSHFLIAKEGTKDHPISEQIPIRDRCIPQQNSGSHCQRAEGSAIMDNAGYDLIDWTELPSSLSLGDT
jgi:hypothetical protein